MVKKAKGVIDKYDFILFSIIFSFAILVYFGYKYETPFWNTLGDLSKYVAGTLIAILVAKKFAPLISKALRKKY